jgi:hypothetical protein
MFISYDLITSLFRGYRFGANDRSAYSDTKRGYQEKSWT